jgi:hypothetical protein
MFEAFVLHTLQIPSGVYHPAYSLVEFRLILLSNLL